MLSSESWLYNWLSKWPWVSPLPGHLTLGGYFLRYKMRIIVTLLQVCCKDWVMFWHEKHHTEGLTCARCLKMFTAFLGGSPNTGLRFRSKVCQQRSWEIHILYDAHSFHSPRCLHSVASPSISFTLLASYWPLALSQLKLPEPSFFLKNREKTALLERCHVHHQYLENGRGLDAVSIIPFLAPTF